MTYPEPDEDEIVARVEACKAEIATILAGEPYVARELLRSLYLTTERELDRRGEADDEITPQSLTDDAVLDEQRDLYAVALAESVLQLPTLPSYVAELAPALVAFLKTEISTTVAGSFTVGQLIVQARDLITGHESLIDDHSADADEKRAELRSALDAKWDAFASIPEPAAARFLPERDDFADRLGGIFTITGTEDFIALTYPSGITEPITGEERKGILANLILRETGCNNKQAWVLFNSADGWPTFMTVIDEVIETLRDRPGAKIKLSVDHIIEWILSCEEPLAERSPLPHIDLTIAKAPLSIEPDTPSR